MKKRAVSLRFRVCMTFVEIGGGTSIATWKGKHTFCHMSAWIGEAFFTWAGGFWYLYGKRWDRSLNVHHYDCLTHMENAAMVPCGGIVLSFGVSQLSELSTAHASTRRNERFLVLTFDLTSFDLGASGLHLSVDDASASCNLEVLYALNSKLPSHHPRTLGFQCAPMYMIMSQLKTFFTVPVEQTDDLLVSNGFPLLQPYLGQLHQAPSPPKPLKPTSSMY